MFGPRLHRANLVALRRLIRRSLLRPGWVWGGPRAGFLDRKVYAIGYYRRVHGLPCCPEPHCQWCYQPSKVRGWGKTREFWFRYLGECSLAWDPYPCGRGGGLSMFGERLRPANRIARRRWWKCRGRSWVGCVQRRTELGQISS